MAEPRMRLFWDERTGGPRTPGSSPPWARVPSDEAVSLSPVSPRRTKASSPGVPRGVSADKPPIAPAFAKSGRPTEVVEEPLEEGSIHFSPMSSFASAGSKGSSASAARLRRRRKDLEVLQIELDVLDVKIDALANKVEALEKRASRL